MRISNNNIYYENIADKCYVDAINCLPDTSATRKKPPSMPPFLFDHRLQLLTEKYTIKQLIDYMEMNNISSVGKKTKDVLKRKLYVHLHLSHYATIIQKLLRGWITRQYNKIIAQHQCRDKCTNDADFATLDPLSELPNKYFFSYIDSYGVRYGFDIRSFKEWISKHDGASSLENPYTRDAFSERLLNDLSVMAMVENVYLKINTKRVVDQVTDKQYAIQLFQKINRLGHYADFNWVIGLNRRAMVAFLHEIDDIWEYRLGLSTQNKILICPPRGNPFDNGHTRINYSDSQLQHYILVVIDRLINSATNQGDQGLGAYYVLGALTLVNKNAAVVMPWLFQSFFH